MNDHVYSVTEIVGTSKTSVEDVVQHGIKTAAKTLRNLEWFEVTQIKGHIVDGRVGHYQVCMSLDFATTRADTPAIPHQPVGATALASKHGSRHDS